MGTSTATAQKKPKLPKRKPSKNILQEKATSQKIHSSAKIHALKKNDKFTYGKVVRKNFDQHHSSTRNGLDARHHGQNTSQNNNVVTRAKVSRPKVRAKSTKKTKSKSQKAARNWSYQKVKPPGHPKSSKTTYVMQLLNRKTPRPSSLSHIPVSVSAKAVSSPAGLRKHTTKATKKSSVAKNRYSTLKRIKTLTARIPNQSVKSLQHVKSKATPSPKEVQSIRKSSRMSAEHKPSNFKSIKSSKLSTKTPSSNLKSPKATTRQPSFTVHTPSFMKNVPSTTSCRITRMLNDYSLRYAAKAGRFAFVGQFSKIEECANLCCRDLQCNLVILVNHNCFKVQCFGIFCQTVPIKRLGFHSKLAFVARSSGMSCLWFHS